MQKLIERNPGSVLAVVFFLIMAVESIAELILG